MIGRDMIMTSSGRQYDLNYLLTTNVQSNDDARDLLEYCISAERQERAKGVEQDRERLNHLARCISAMHGALKKTMHRDYAIFFERVARRLLPSEDVALIDAQVDVQIRLSNAKKKLAGGGRGLPRRIHERVGEMEQP